MSRDYAKNRLSQRPAKSSSFSLGFAWLFIGIFIGLVMGSIFYFKNQKSPSSLSSVSSQASVPSALSVSSGKTVLTENAETNTEHTKTKLAEPKNNTAETKSSSDTKNPQALQTQFDFYSVLPSQKTVGPAGDEDVSHLQTQAQNNPSPIEPDESDKPVDPDDASSTTDNTDTNNTDTTDTDNTTITGHTDNTRHTDTEIKSELKPTTQAEPKSSQTERPDVYILQIAALSQNAEAEALKAKLTLLGFDIKTAVIHKKGKTLKRVFLGPFDSVTEAESMQTQLKENMIPSQRLKFQH